MSSPKLPENSTTIVAEKSKIIREKKKYTKLFL
jgi:hypothetical protein